MLAGYVLGAAVGVGLMADRDELLRLAAGAAWLAALGLGLVASHGRYREAGAVDRRRMQWIGWALAVGAEAVLVVVALEVLADWPDDPGLVALALTGPRAARRSIAGTYPKLIGRIDRVLTYTVSLAGLTALDRRRVRRGGRRPRPAAGGAASGRCCCCRWWPRASPRCCTSRPAAG